VVLDVFVPLLTTVLHLLIAWSALAFCDCYGRAGSRDPALS